MPTEPTGRGSCDLCLGQGLVEVHRPISSLRGAIVEACPHCGLVQTRYTQARAERHPPSTSSDASWGNVRHAKGLRLDAQWPVVERLLLELPEGSTVLDVGTNRGDFLARAARPERDLRWLGVEPDESLRPNWPVSPGVTVVVARLEDADLEDVRASMVMNLHTLEHADSAVGMLRLLREKAVDGALMYLEVPDISAIDDPAVVEEFFIDKHAYHFSGATLDACLALTGWQIVDRPTDGSRNLTRVCRAGPPDPEAIPVDSVAVVADLQARLDRYRAALAANRADLVLVAAWLAALERRQRVCIWGAGRVFDALVRFGGYRPESALVVDEYLARHLDEIHGIPVHRPVAVAEYGADVCLILASGSAGQIADAARALGIRHLVTFDEALRTARGY